MRDVTSHEDSTERAQAQQPRVGMRALLLGAAVIYVGLWLVGGPLGGALLAELRVSGSTVWYGPIVWALVACLVLGVQVGVHRAAGVRRAGTLVARTSLSALGTAALALVAVAPMYLFNLSAGSSISAWRAYLALVVPALALAGSGSAVIVARRLSADEPQHTTRIGGNEP